jgi:hypothetical protein
MKASDLIPGETYQINARTKLTRKPRNRYSYSTPGFKEKAFLTTGKYVGKHGKQPGFHRFQESDGRFVYANIQSVTEYVPVIEVDSEELERLRERGADGKTRTEEFATAQQLLMSFGIRTEVNPEKTALTLTFFEVQKLQSLVVKMLAAQLEE